MPHSPLYHGFANPVRYKFCHQYRLIMAAMALPRHLQKSVDFCDRNINVFVDEHCQSVVLINRQIKTRIIVTTNCKQVNCCFI